MKHTCLHNQFKLMLNNWIFFRFMTSEMEVAAASLIVALVVKKWKQQKWKRKVRSSWVKPWLKRRDELGVYSTLLQEFRFEDHIEYQQFLRMGPDVFDELLCSVEAAIEGQNTAMRDAIPAKLKLAATIRFLATGACYADLQHLFRIHKSTLSKFIPDVCDAIYKKLKDRYLMVTMYIFNLQLNFKNIHHALML